MKEQREKKGLACFCSWLSGSSERLGPQSWLFGQKELTARVHSSGFVPSLGHIVHMRVTGESGLGRGREACLKGTPEGTSAQTAPWSWRHYCDKKKNGQKDFVLVFSV